MGKLAIPLAVLVACGGTGALAQTDAGFEPVQPPSALARVGAELGLGLVASAAGALTGALLGSVFCPRRATGCGNAALLGAGIGAGVLLPVGVFQGGTRFGGKGVGTGAFLGELVAGGLIALLVSVPSINRGIEYGWIALGPALLLAGAVGGYELSHRILKDRPRASLSFSAGPGGAALTVIF